MSADAGDALRRSKAHILVDDIERPSLDDLARHHVETVLRVDDGTQLTVTDGLGRWRPGVFVRGVGFEPTAAPEFQMRPVREITVGVAIPKQDRPEWIVQKLTEVGVAHIVLLESDRSVVRWGGERAPRKVAKLARTAVEALQQSRGVWLPDLSGPVPAASLLPDGYVAEPGGGPISGEQSTLLIGPEGGWTPDEVAAAKGTVGLGPTILRVETAAITAAIWSLSVV